MKRKNRSGDDRRSREEAALARLRGEHTAYSIMNRCTVIREMSQLVIDLCSFFVASLASLYLGALGPVVLN